MSLIGSTGILLWQQNLSETVGSMQLAAFADPTPIHPAHHESQLSRQAIISNCASTARQAVAAKPSKWQHCQSEKSTVQKVA